MLKPGFSHRKEAFHKFIMASIMLVEVANHGGLVSEVEVVKIP